MKTAAAFLFFAAALTTRSFAIAQDGGLATTLSAEILKDNALDVELGVVNHTGTNLCFFFYEGYPELLDRNGVRLPLGRTGVEIDIFARPNDVQVIWTGSSAYFHPDIGFNRPFATPVSLEDVAKVNYELNLYDCAKLFSAGWGSRTKPRFRRELSTIPGGR